MKTNFILALVVSVMTGNLRAAETEPPLIVLRFSEQSLNRSIDEPIERTSAVDKVIMDTHVVGSAVTKGRPSLELLDDDAGVSFRVRYRGATVARTAGFHAPVVIYTRSDTEFTAEKTVTLEQSGRMRVEPTSIEARTVTTAEDITTERRFPLRRMVLRKAWQSVTANMDQANVLAGQDARERIKEAFDAAVDSRLEKLEKQLVVRRFVSTMLPDDAGPVYRSVTNGGYLNVAVYASDPESKIVDVRLPRFIGARESIQIWLRRSLVAEQIDTALVGVDTWRRIASLPTTWDSFLQGRAQPAGAWTIVGDWYVVQLNQDRLSR